MTTATLRRIVAVALARPDKYASRTTAAPGLVAAAPVGRVKHRPDI
jgi:hypothetical protein